MIRIHSLSCVLLVTCILAGTTAAAADFAEFLKRVKERDARTESILRVQASEQTQAKHGLKLLWNFEIKRHGELAEVKVFNNYKTGPVGETYTFDFDDDVSRELTRYQNHQQLLAYDAAVAKAERERRVFLHSGFRLKVGAKRSEIEVVFGKPAEIHYPTEAGSLLLDYQQFAVELDSQVLWDIHLKRP